MQLSLGNHTSVGRVRTANEDAFGNWLTPNGHLFVVCDGMGGHIGGAIASQQAVAAIYQTMAAQPYPSAPIALQFCLEEANKKLRSMVEANPSLHGMGTTAVVVLIQGSTAFYAHIGDSRLYLFRQNTLRRLTRDHSFVQSLVDQGHITEEDAEKHPRRNEIYRALGIQDTIDPTVTQTPLLLEPGDRLILCTDGLNGMIGDRGITAVLSERGLSVQQQSERLVQLADEAGGHDNTTVQIIHTRPVMQPVAAPAPEPSKTVSALPPVPPTARVEAIPKPKQQSDRARDSFMRMEDKPKPKKERKSVLPMIGGIALFLALILILYNVFRSPDTPKLGMEGPVFVDTELINTPIVDSTPAVQEAVSSSDPAMVPRPDISTPPDTTPMPRLPETSSADGSSSDTSSRPAKKPTPAKPPKKDTVRKKAVTPATTPVRTTPSATRPAPTRTTTPTQTQTQPTRPEPKPEETPAPRPKAVMPPPEP